ncbi:EthD family reductase [Modicisalibacter tunisiensis]|uniref:EthD family reductase n=1 Tax=Modicisalibacter tunisiensis TaxID=390637 RepID=A0ABS7WZ38_9GAMM|nr:EthD family reductase [Modicisalibacter tunisiensis]MBZ9539615.1 EthD family reductase [Modicisalibacter tunisiensis]MBZ9566981.1 EthD family reductase [Modicisalibacter tunisiensis]
MIDIMVAYPSQDNLAFDDRYYLEKHVPLVEKKLGEHGLRYARVHRGTDASSPYYLIAHLGFDSPAAFESAFDAVGQQIMDDIPHFTNAEPVLQVSEVITLSTAS